MNHKKISMETWPRAKLFRHFIDDVRCVICVTANIDITNVLSYCKSGGRRFYPTFLHIVATVVNGRDEFKMGYDAQGEPVVWDTVFPSHVVFHPEDNLFTRLITAYSPDRGAFYTQVLADMEKHKDRRGHEIEYPYRNTFDVSCLPWLHYNTCDLHIFDSGTYLAPVITWGKFEEQNRRMILRLPCRYTTRRPTGTMFPCFIKICKSKSHSLQTYKEKNLDFYRGSFYLLCI